MRYIPMKPAPEILTGASDCPASMEVIVEYLDLEDYARQRDTPQFFFHAESDVRRLWVWKYLDRTNAVNYVVVTQPKPAERADMYEIGCGPTGRPNETPSEALTMFATARLWF